MKWRALFILFFLLGFAGCSISGLPDDTGPIGYQTQIITAHAVPNTVAPGDTVRFVCVIRDSTNSKFRFYWYAPHGTPIGGKDTTYGSNGVRVTSANWIKWRAPDKANLYPFDVTVDNGDENLLPVTEAFVVTVN